MRAGTTSTADVTVVVPAMNRSGLIGRALASVHAQTTRPARIIVVDDASDDGTGDAARAAGAEVLEMSERSGSGPARNTGIRAATTEWVAFLDSDDEWLPRHLQTVLGHARGHDLASTAAMSTSGRWLGETPLRRRVSSGPSPARRTSTCGSACSNGDRVWWSGMPRSATTSTRHKPSGTWP